MSILKSIIIIYKERHFKVTCVLWSAAMSPPDAPHRLMPRFKIFRTSSFPLLLWTKVSAVLLLQVQDVVNGEGQRSAPARGVLFAHIPRHFICACEIPKTPSSPDGPSTIAPRLQLAHRGVGATLFNDPEDCGLAAFDWWGCGADEGGMQIYVWLPYCCFKHFSVRGIHVHQYWMNFFFFIVSSTCTITWQLFVNYGT